MKVRPTFLRQRVESLQTVAIYKRKSRAARRGAGGLLSQSLTVTLISIDFTVSVKPVERRKMSDSFTLLND